MSLRSYRSLLFIFIFLFSSLWVSAQDGVAVSGGALFRFEPPEEALHLPDVENSLLPHAPLPLMAPDLALQAFQHNGEQQSRELPSYTDETLVIAELPETAQRGAFELQRSYVAPHTLNYKPIQFTGDGFVKSNVITRVLQSEVDFVQKGDAQQVALTDANYKFSYKGLQDLDGHSAYVYQVKARAKRVGLFKGRIYLDAHNGNVLRTEGTIIKSPSFFVRKLEFVQDYASVDGYTLPAHLHSTAKASIVGQTVVDIYHRGYQLTSASAAAFPALGNSGPH
jgi:hypothetical protein